MGLKQLPATNVGSDDSTPSTQRSVSEPLDTVKRGCSARVQLELGEP
jgi:hypothetical protein